MAMGKSKSEKEASTETITETTETREVVERPGSQPLADEVAMVSRNADGSDAQPHKTVRILDDEAAAEADKAQLDIVDK